MAEASQLDISRLENKIDSLAKTTEEVTYRMNRIDSEINGISNELKNLVESFQKMMVEQRKAAALQQATTELVRVRQEIENKYGSYKVVRETMLGVLQATDLALVKKTTISRVSEELMLSTPKYWLAPCLVAVSAWIANDRDLAERAIAEAVKRDEEKTALTMALICRRNNRVQTCYEWLSIYFAKQNAANFSEATFIYIDAYVNGVFGPDDKHMCDDYITKWINEIRGSSSLFEKEQEELWKEYCEKFQSSIENRYPELKDCVKEYDRIDAYVGRIHSVDSIAENFKRITNAPIDQERLKVMIDKELISLVSRYDVEEEPLRKEEEYLKAVKKFDGDTEAAKQSIKEAENLRQVQALNLVEQMTRIIKTEEDVLPSERKTAVSFLSDYIKKGFNRYITEKKADFPESITINVNGWTGTTADGSNLNQLCTDYDSYLSECCRREVEIAANTKEPRNWIIGAISLGVFALIMMIVAFPFGILLALGAGACMFMNFKSKRNIDTNIANINQKYMDLGVQGKNKIATCVNQWTEVRNVVNQFANEPIKEIVA